MVILRYFISFIFKPITIWLLPINLSSFVAKKREREGRSGNYWKDIEEDHRIKRRELSFRKGREDWYQRWLDPWAETQLSLSLSLSHCSSLISHLYIFLYFDFILIFSLPKRKGVFLTSSRYKISSEGSDWSRGSHACYQRYPYLYCQRDVMLRLVPSELCAYTCRQGSRFVARWKERGFTGQTIDITSTDTVLIKFACNGLVASCNGYSQSL